MDEPKVVQLRLDPTGVAAPAQRAAIIASQVVGVALRALANDEVSPPAIQGGHLRYQFYGLEMTDSERQQIYINCILSKGFQDLARGVRETLEEAKFYLDAMKLPPRHNALETASRFGIFEKKSRKTKLSKFARSCECKPYSANDI